MSDSVMAPLMVVVALLAAGAFVKVSGLVLRWVVRRVADGRRSRVWRVRAVRGGQETHEMWERNRRQRIDAAARGVNHIVAVAVWVVAGVVVFHLLEVEAAFFLSSAGFIGVGIAFGGQSKVNDYLTGLSVLFEDRYGVGDDIEVSTTNGNDLRATVEHVGLLTTRLRDRNSTYHIPNSEVSLLRNHSQDPGWTRLQVNVDADDAEERSEEVIRALRRQAGSTHLTDVFFVGDLTAAHAEGGTVHVDVQTVKPLDDRTRDVLQRRAEESLRRYRG